mgnify:CR=1 FL=1
MGFWSVATDATSPTGTADVLFQSRSGFLVRRDRLARPSGLSAHQVSIPQWVSGPSRLIAAQNGAVRPICFNPAVGFWSVATNPVAKPSDGSESRFNPAVGFWSVATVKPRRGVNIYPTVSIPQWVSGPSRPRRDSRSRSGRLCFNPAVGFWSVATRVIRCGPVDFDTVSIPQWVSGPSRLSRGVRRGIRRRVVSIPQWVSGPSRQRRGLGLQRGQQVSIPQWVSGPSRRRRALWRSRWHEVSIPQWVSGPSRPSKSVLLHTTTVVSIPQWVSGPSRLTVSNNTNVY